MTEKNDEKKKIAEAEKLYQQGLAHAAKEEYDQAMECFEKAIELNPKHHLAWYDLGNGYYLIKGDFEQAIECWEKALEIKPDEIDVLYNMGNAYRERGEYDRANECYLKAIELNPDDHEAWNNMGNSYSMARKIDQAIECYKKAVEIKPDKIETWFNLSVTYRRIGALDLALECCQKVLEFRPDFREANRLLRTILREKGEPEEVEEPRVKEVQKLPVEEAKETEEEAELKLFASSVAKSKSLLDVSDPITHLRELIDKFPKDKEEALAKLIFKIGKNIANVGFKTEKGGTKTKIIKKEGSNLTLGVQILELALNLPNCPDKLLSFLNVIYNTEGDWEKAIELNEKALSTVSKSNRAMFVTGLMYAAFKAERLDIIEKYLDDFLEDPQLLDDPYSLSNIIYALNRKEMCETSIKLTKAYWEKADREMILSLHVNMIDTFIVANKMDPIYEELVDEALKKMEEDDEYCHPVMFENIACFYAMKGLLEETIRYLKEAKKRGHPGFQALKDLECFKPFKANEKFLKLFK